MLQYGSNVICMDDTHGTNAYDFSLITVLVIDSHGEGIPVALAISNCVDVSMFVEFVKPLKARVGVTNPAVFMSDMADNSIMHGLEFLVPVSQDNCIVLGMLTRKH